MLLTDTVEPGRYEVEFPDYQMIEKQLEKADRILKPIIDHLDRNYGMNCIIIVDGDTMKISGCQTIKLRNINRNPKHKRTYYSKLQKFIFQLKTKTNKRIFP